MSRAEFISDKIDIHQEKIRSSINNLERKIISKIQSDPNLVAEDLSIRTRTAIEYRNNLRADFQNIFLKTADNNVRDYDSIVNNFMGRFRKLSIPTRFKSLTKPDLATILDLKKFSFNKYKELSNTFYEAVSNDLYESVITGKPFPEMVKSIRGRLNGIYQSSNEEAINRLVRFIDDNQFNTFAADRVATARKILNQKYASDVLGNNLRRYSRTIAHDSLMEFNGAFTKYKAEQAGIFNYVYDGTLILDSRDFCRRNLGKVFSASEIDAEWQSQTWKGKSGNNPFTNRGGYNCRHILDPFEPEFDEDIEESEPSLTKPFGTNKGKTELKLIDQSYNHMKGINSPIMLLIARHKSGGIETNRKAGRRGGSISHFDPTDSKVYMTKDYHVDPKDITKGLTEEGQKIFRHEYGHVIDDAVQNYILINRKRIEEALGLEYKTIGARGSNFIAGAMAKDRALYAGRRTTNGFWGLFDDVIVAKNNTIDKYLTARPDFPLNKIDIERLGITKVEDLETIYKRQAGIGILQKLNGSYRNGGSIADTVGAITSLKNGWGHTRRYYESGKKYNVGKYSIGGGARNEVFANYFQVMASPERIALRKLLQWYAPNTTTMMDNLVKELLK